MTTTDPRHYDVILSPAITEKATLASDHNQVVFKVATDGPRKGDLSLVNTHQRNGEESVYFSSPSAPIREDYGVVGLLPGLSAARHALILAGLTTLGTQAAVEFVCRPRRAET